MCLSIGQCIVGIVIATLLVLSLMVNNLSIFYLYFACRPVALEVLHIRSSIPQTPLRERKQLQRLHCVTGILQCQFLHFSPRLQRHKEQHRGFNTILATRNTCIVHTVTAFIRIEWRLARFPTRTPNTVAILDIEVTATSIHRHTIIAIARDATELGILIEVVATSRVRNQSKEVFVAQIVNPRERCCGVSDDVLAVLIVEISKCLHTHFFTSHLSFLTYHFSLPHQQVY